MTRAHIVLLAHAAALVLSAPARADRAAVELVLAEMSRAALAGDQAAYLSHVDRSDPIFFKEQENWARDFKRHVPTECEFSIGERKDGRVFGERDARFELVVSWTIPEIGRGGKDFERTVSFPAVFTLDAAGGKWLYSGEDWRVLDGDALDDEEKKDEASNTPSGDKPAKSSAEAPAVQCRARVKYFAGYEEAANNIVAVLPEVRAHVDDGFGRHIDRVQEVKLYPEMKHLQESIYLSYVDGLTGWNEPGESIKLMVRPKASKVGLRALLAHEYGHVATFELGPKASGMPWWALEGVAELSAEHYASQGRDAAGAVRAWFENDTLAPWEEMADFHNTPPKWSRQVYKQSQHMLGFISERYGREKRIAWLGAMANGATIEDASTRELGLSFADLDKAWRAAVADDAAKFKREREAKELEKAAEKGESASDGSNKAAAPDAAKP